MECPDVNQIVDFVDGDPAPETRVELEAHLAACSSCREMVAAMARGGAAPELGAGVMIGRFAVEEVVGRGGMGVVYRAHDPELGRSVAIKLVRPGREAATEQARARLTREARALARLSHPNVVAVYDVGDHGDGIYIAMEYVSGETLREWLETPRGQDEIVDVLLDAGAGLHAAHTAGLVHRDVKPDNLVIGADRRARVLDFGLVGVAAAGAAAAAGADTSLTRTGALLGTPAFMAPEQAEGQPVDARSDQFSFCATACEALGGARPVSGRSPAEIADALGRGEIRVPARIAPRIRAVLVRGLERDPGRRFPSMRELLAALAAARRPPAWRARALAVGAALAIGAATAGLAATFGASSTEPCGGAAEALSAAWGPAQAAAVGERFAASGHPGAEAARDRVTGLLDDYRAGWIAMRTEACRATRIERTQSETVLDQRMRCLDRRLAALRGLVAGLSRELDVRAVDGAITAAIGLPPLEACADLEAIGRATPLPAEPDRRAAFLELEARIAETDPIGELGRYDEALAAALAIAESARALDHPAVEAQARVLVARAANGAGQIGLSEAALRAAVRLGSRAGDDRTVAEAWIRLIETHTFTSHFDGALALVEVAEAAVLRAGEPPELVVTLDVIVADALSWTGNLDAAIARVDHAVAVAERELPAGHPTLALARIWRGDLLEDADRGAEAIESLSRGIAAFREIYGEDHPALMWPTSALGTALIAVGRPDQGRAALERAVELAGPSGQNHPDLIDTHQHLGNLAWTQDRLDDALAAFRRSAEIAEVVGGADDYRRARALGSVANILFDQGDIAAAEEAWTSALEIRRRSMGPTHHSVGAALHHLGRAAAARGDRALAIARYEEALVLLDAGPPDDVLRLTGEVRTLLAMILWDDPAERDRARTLAAEAEERLVAAGSKLVLPRLRAWRETHR